MMQAETKCTDRIARLRDEREQDHDRAEIRRRDSVYEKSFEQHPDDIAAVRFAYGFQDFLKEKKILIKPYDILAGHAFRYSYNTTMPIIMPRDHDPRYRPEFGVDSYREVRESADWHGFAEDSEERNKMNTFALSVINWLYKHWESGHILPGYERVLRYGFGGLIEEGEAILSNADEQGKGFINAMLITNKAAGAYIKRYEKLAREMASETIHEEEKQQLQKIADACAQIALGKPRTFFEAVQLLWFTHELLYAENVPTSISLGRLDKILFPYYEKDVKEGKLTYEEASEIIDALWIKFSANLHAYQNVTIGGYDENDDFLANDLTFIILQATRRLQFDQPLICLRYNDKMPDDLWAESLELIKTGTGFPAFFYDDMCVKAKQDMDIALEDAKDYAMIGCVEMAVPGKEYSKTEVLRLNWPMMLELMMTGGKAALTGDELPLKTKRNLDDIKTFDEFYAWYQDEMLHYTALAMDTVNYLDSSLMDLYPTPFLSTTMEGCYQKGRDVTGGGTIYNNSGVSVCGMANAVDSLAAIKKLVFDDKKYTLSEYAQAMEANFEGWEELQLEASRHCPKFGNDDDQVDLFMSELVAATAELVQCYKTPRGGKWQLGLYSVEDHSKMGLHTGATPDGRPAEVSLANAISPVQGKDIVGPTAVINSLLKTDLSAATNGMVLDLKFSPQFLEKEQHTNALKMLIESYFERGGMEVQFNVVSRETLIDAQLHPEKHKDLVVRVSGFSAYFTTLIKTTQDEIIARTEYAVM